MTTPLCRHSWQFYQEHPDYLRCSKCGTCRSTVAPPAAEVYTSGYWTHERGHSTIDEQVYNCDVHEENGKTKNQFVLDLIDVDERVSAFEIGCSPGALLRDLQHKAGFKSIRGCDPLSLADEMWKGEGWRVNSVHVGHNAFFPDCTRREVGGQHDLIVACDVFEHSHEPEAFLTECARLLCDGGQLILMLPLIVDGEELPERMWNAQEHVYLHSLTDMTALLSSYGFEDIEHSRWCPGHDVISAHHRLRPALGRRAIDPAVYDGDEVGCF